MKGVVVRRARVGDLEAVLDLWEEMMAFHAKLDPRFGPAKAGRAYFRETLREWMHDDNCTVLVAVTGGEVVGYTVGRIAENPPVFVMRHYGHVSDICVASHLRRAGIGNKLFAAACDWFRSQGLTVVQLNTASFNPVSRAFWKKIGFQDFLHRMWLDV